MTLSVNGPLLVFGGPYSNLEAVLAIRNVARLRNIPPQNCLCTGDVVAYCADPRTVVKEIRDWGCRVVMGNCEESLGYGSDDCGCGFEEGTACDVLSKQWFDYASARLGEEDRVWMRQLPRSIELKMGEVTLEAIHGGVTEINKFVFASEPDVLVKELAKTAAHIILGGHCGLPFSARVGSRLWVNAGVIGMPANDGTPDGWYSLLTPKGAGIEVSFHRLGYDYQISAEKMRKNQLAEGYATALETGLWPSLDVLPEREKRHVGQRISLGTCHYMPG